FDIQKLTRFVEAYQRVQPLTIGELWALAITLRITLVENLRRLAEAIVARLTLSRLADTFADRISGIDKGRPEQASAILKSLDQVPWSTTFSVQLTQRLRDHDPNATPALRWLNERLEAKGISTDQIVREEVQQQSAMNVTVRNVITSMRLVSMMNWAEFFESVSPVDAVMRRGSDFAAMDFPTRDLYRRAIEDIARGSDRDEVEIARRAIAAAKRAGNAAEDRLRKSDPGYYLISDGRRAFEKDVQFHVPLKTRLLRLNSNLGVMSYVSIIAAATALILIAGLLCVGYAGVSGWTLVLFAVVGFVPSSDVAVTVVNRVITQQIGATLLPGLELRDGIPPDLATMVAVPILLMTIPEVADQIEKLEVHHLSNPDANFSFALLSDWKDSDCERSADDDACLDAAVAAIACLNKRYGLAGDYPRFFILHRRRIW
ncbi:MAG: glycosyl transferase, partial [Bryobacteraceae bacterium]